MINGRPDNPAPQMDGELPIRLPDGLTWHGYLVQLLHIASSIEHALLTQYLYAAYSLDDESASKTSGKIDLEKINVWRNLILSIAKEEMGHLLTVQNVICLLGGQMELARESYPWDSNFYPFAFHLERLTVGSLACYIYAEMGTEPHHDEFLDDIVELVRTHLSGHAEQEAKDRLEKLREQGAHQVSVIYEQIIKILADSNRIPDTHFHDTSVLFQASADEWNRGHWAELPGALTTDFREHARSVISGMDKRRRDIAAKATQANVMIETVATREQAVAALTRIAAQGEGKSFHEESHFARFCLIMTDFREFRRKDPKWEPWTHRVADDPRVSWLEPRTESTITHRLSEKWASLFNLRYRMMLTYLSHSFQLARDEGQARLRGAVIHKVFAEMYNLKAIAGILVRLPFGSPKNELRAGPPFQMPYTLAISMDPMDRWRLHRDLIDGSLKLNSDLRDARVPLAERSYLSMLQELDQQSDKWIEKVIAGPMRDGKPLR